MKKHNFLVNGEFNQSISPLDRGFAYGDGIFRTIRMQGGVPINWHLHYPKLVEDCAAINIVCPNAKIFIDDLERLFMQDAINNDLSVAKIIITRGQGQRGYATPAITTPLRVVIKSDMPVYPEQYLFEGIKLHVCTTTLAKQPLLAGVKHLNRIENVMARMEWHDETLFDGILLDQDGHVIECTMSNIFARFGDTLLTPELNNCGVAGVTRALIMGFATALDLTIQTAQFNLDKLITADEIIICNSLYGALQVKQIDNQTWPSYDLATNIRNTMKYHEIL